MYFTASPQQQLELFHQREKELLRQAAEFRLARSAKQERTGRWPRLTRKQRETQVSLAS